MRRNLIFTYLNIDNGFITKLLEVLFFTKGRSVSSGLFLLYAESDEKKMNVKRQTQLKRKHKTQKTSVVERTVQIFDQSLR